MKKIYSIEERDKFLYSEFNIWENRDESEPRKIASGLSRETAEKIVFALNYCEENNIFRGE